MVKRLAVARCVSASAFNANGSGAEREPLRDDKRRRGGCGFAVAMAVKSKSEFREESGELNYSTVPYIVQAARHRVIDGSHGAFVYVSIEVWNAILQRM